MTCGTCSGLTDCLFVAAPKALAVIASGSVRSRLAFVSLFVYLFAFCVVCISLWAAEFFMLSVSLY